MPHRLNYVSLVAGLFAIAASSHAASVSSNAQDKLNQLLLGKDVRALVEMPAYKDGIDIYYTPPSGKRVDERGLDLGEMTKWLKDKGVGVDRDEWTTITNVKFDSDTIEIHLGGGGEGRRGSNHANKVGAGYKRAGGSRINFKYQRDLRDRDLDPDLFLIFMARMLDTSKIKDALEEKAMPVEFRDAITAKTVREGMTYQMVLMSMGDPDQKNVAETTDSSLRESWFYLKDGHRWVVKFENGKVASYQVF
jgi:hypothetical protein